MSLASDLQPILDDLEEIREAADDVEDKILDLLPANDNKVQELSTLKGMVRAVYEYTGTPISEILTLMGDIEHDFKDGDEDGS